MNELHNPWTVLAEKQVYENPWIGVTEFDVLNPTGGKGIYGKVHFKNIAIGVLPIDEAGNTYLVGQYRFPLGKYSWEIPEGGGPLGTHPIDSAKRELEEETGLVAASWVQIQEMHLSNSVSDEYCVIYLARNLEQKAAMPEETEQLVVRKLPFSELYHMVAHGVITDAITVAAVLKVHIMILEGTLKFKG
jgi:8-oxo-dGTP pyrophosphatase MutT (NUDIX family)